VKGKVCCYRSAGLPTSSHNAPAWSVVWVFSASILGWDSLILDG
jgi:hypothetical protein